MSINKILIVDDEEDIRRLLERALGMKGFDVFTASSALDALVKLQDNQVGIIITDIRMPGMDGFDLISQAHEINADIPVIAITGYGDSGMAVEAISRGAFFFINKPFNLTTILNVISKVQRMPCLASDRDKVIPHATHTMEYSFVPGVELIEGVNYHVSRTARDMGFAKHCYGLVAPFVVDELLMQTATQEGDENPAEPVDTRVVITSEKIVVEVKSGASPFTRESDLPDLDEIDTIDEDCMGMTMVRYLADELSFGENGASARAVISRNSCKGRCFPA